MSTVSLPYKTPIDLSNCEKEPIHTPGQIQAHGALWVVEHQTRRIVQVSTNIAQFLGRSPDEILGLPLAEVMGEIAAEACTKFFAPSAPQRTPRHGLMIDLGRGELDIIVHIDGPLVIFEAELAQAKDMRTPDFFDFASRVISELTGALSKKEYCHLLAGAIRDLTGYDRVMIYRFGHDWSGEVFAESMAPGKGLHPFLGLHYPASDIPAQARALFLKNGVRMLPDANYVPVPLVPEFNPVTGMPLDMSHAFLRGASQMYTEYLVNMGVSGTLTLAISDGEKLWGLVACHHYSPRRITHGQRMVCDLLARVASMNILARARGDESMYRQRIDKVHAALVEAMATSNNFGTALVRTGELVKSFVDCTGVAVISASAIDTFGVTPPAVHLERLASLFSALRPSAIVACTRLSDVYKDAAEIADVAAGVLALPLSKDGDQMVMWFRPEVICAVNWAGDPHKPVSIGPMGDRLTPRKSFELWSETVRGACEPWTRIEQAAAERLRTSFVEILAWRHASLEKLNADLARSNAELESFAYVASHDLKEPLRGIYNHAAFLLRDAKARLVQADTARIDSIIRLANRTRDLVDALLEYSRLGRGEPHRELRPLKPLIEEALELVAAGLQQRNARVDVADHWPTIWCVPALLLTTLSNLVSNAAKYNDRAEPHIELGVVAAGDPGFPAQARGAAHAYFVRDDGIGIAPRHREAVFQIFRRLHQRDKYGGGTGAGLTIVKKAVERMGGAVWIGDADSGGTTFWFTLDERSSDLIKS